MKCYLNNAILIIVLILLVEMSDDCHEVICKDNPFGNLRKNLPSFLKEKHECPLSKEELGNFTWSTLHTYAAYYPVQPS